MQKIKLFLYSVFGFFTIYCFLLFLIVWNLSGVVILKPRCGIGNQLFQFAAAYSLSKKTDSKLYIIHDSQNTAQNQTSLDNSYILNHFNIEASNINFTKSNWINLAYWLSATPISSWLNEKIFAIKFANEKNFFQYSKMRNIGLIVINDYFESEIYFKNFKEEIIKQLTPKNINLEKLQDLAEKLSKNNSVCVHIKGGDYLKNRFYDAYILPIEYQKEAIKLAKQIIPDAIFFVFSDHTKLSQQELSTDISFNFIDNENYSSLESLFLMSKCSHNIITNDTFSWWSAYINHSKNHITIAPRHKYNSKFYQNIYDKKKSYWKKALIISNAYPENWILLDHNNNTIQALIESLKLDQATANDIMNTYYKKSFNIYNGKLEELDLCSDFLGKKYICQVNIDDLHNKPTVVTSYYKVRSKFSDAQYDEWMQTFLKIPFNLVVYTDQESAIKIKKYRGNLPIHLIIKDFEDLYYYKFYENYKKMYVNDSNKNHSPELYVIWAEKIKFVNDAIEKDYYHSDFFVWCDIGIFRDMNYFSYKFPQIKHMIHNKISFGMVNDFENYEIQNKLMAYGGSIQRTAAGLQVGNKAAWKIYDMLWDNIIQDLKRHDMDFSNDQRIIGTIALRYPDFINLLYPPIWYKGNKWWYPLLYYSDKEIN